MLIAKITLIPLLILLVSLISHRFGPRVAGMLTGFPLVAGPITGFLYIEQGAEFAIVSAESTLLGVLPITVLCLVYCHMVLKYGLLASMCTSMIAYILSVFAATYIQLPTFANFILVLSGIVLSLRLAHAVSAEKVTGNIAGVELLARMLFCVLLILMVTAVAPHVGPSISGFLAVFPIATVTLALFTHLNSATAVVSLLTGLIYGLFSFASFYLLLVILSQHMPFVQAFAASALGAAMVQLVLKECKSRFEAAKQAKAMAIGD